MKMKVLLGFASVLLLLVLNSGPIRAASSGRFGVALGTWDYPGLNCFTLNGDTDTCQTTYNQYYHYNFSDMGLTTYDSSAFHLAPDAFNVASLAARDPKANTQFIWFHYDDYLNPWQVTSGTYDYTDTTSYTRQRLGRAMTNSELTNNQLDTPMGAHIYVTAGAPGSIEVLLQKEPSTVIGGNWRIRLPQIIYENGYPYCNGCIYRESDFLSWLRQNQGFNDGDGHGYSFYVLAETEWSNPSDYLEPYEYAAVFNEFVQKVLAVYPNARFVLSSPVAGSAQAAHYETYFRSLYDPNLKLLSPQAIAAVTFNGADVFTPAVTGPDTTKNGVSPVTDASLRANAQTAFNDAYIAGNFFYGLNGKPTLLTQSGINNWPAPIPFPGTIHPGVTCGWCRVNSDVLFSTEYGSARELQIFYGNLAQQTAATHVAAWAYWGNIQQVLWNDALTLATWGDLNHGIFPLSWPIICTIANHCPTTTNQVWPTRLGMEYLHLANQDYSYIPDAAPTWWPPQTTPMPILTDPILPTTVPCPIFGDLTNDCHVNGTDAQIFLSTYGWSGIPGSKIEDLTHDGIINAMDFGVIANSFGR